MVDGGLTGYTFAGIANAEYQDRVNEHRSGVPAPGGAQALLSAPINRTSGVGVMNVSNVGVHARLKHRGSTKTRTSEPLTALNQGSGKFIGKLQFRSITKGSVTVTATAGANAVVDVNTSGVADGTLYDTGTNTKRGTIDYVNGIVNFTMSGTPTEMVSVTYQHTDATDFETATQAISAAGGAQPVTVTLAFGRVTPGSISFQDSAGGPLTFVDDGKGNLIKTNAGAVAKAGTVDYLNGVIVITTNTTGTLTGTYTFNPFAAKLAAGGGQKMIELLPGNIPEMSRSAWAAGMKNETDAVLWGESFGTNPLGTGNQGAVIAKWMHFGEDPFRVKEEYSGLVPGGQSNDTRVL